MTHPLLAALPPLSAALFLADTPRFHPSERTELERVTTWAESIETVDVEILQDGEPAAGIPSVTAAVDRTLSITTIDTFLRSDINRPLEIVRRFDDVTMEMEADLTLGMPDGDVELTVSGEGESELESVGVRLSWDEDASTWIKTFADDFEGREELLEGLEPNAEFIALLPAADEVAAVGDRWDIDAGLLPEILRPGGICPVDKTTDLEALDGVLDPLLLPGPFDLVGGAVDGEIEAELKSMEEGVATIEISIDAKVASEAMEAIDALIQGAAPDGATIDLQRADYVTRFDGKATLVWSVEGQHMVSFAFESDVEIDVEIGVEVGVEGQVSLYELSEKRAGTVQLSVE